MKNIKILFIILCLLFVFCLTAFSSYATYDEINNKINDEFYSEIDSEITKELQNFGISDWDVENIYNVSFKNFSQYFATTLPEQLKSCVTDFFSLLCVVITVSLVSAFWGGTEQAGYFNIIGVITVTVITVNKLSVVINALLSSIRLSGNFMVSFIPILTFLLCVSGNPTTAFTYNSLIMAFSQGISSFINYIAVDLVGCFFCLSISFNMNSIMNIGRFISSVNKAVAFILGIIASVFTGFLSIKSVLSASVDSVAVKGVRYAINSMVPVLGSSISEAYSSILGSINIMKGSVAFLGIIVITIINTPVVVRILSYNISFSVLSYICEAAGLHRMADTFKSFSCGLKILLLLCIFQMFVLIISTGIMLTIKGGG